MLKYFRIAMIFFTTCSLAQTGQTEINAGYSFYDAFRLGVAYNFNNRMGLGGAIGIDDHFLSNEKYISGSIEVTTGIIKNNEGNRYNFCINSRLYFWQIEDRFYKFRVITLNPALVYRVYTGSRIYFSFSAGPAFNIVVYNHRKTFEEVGWPHYVQFNPGFKINYILVR